MSSTITVSPHHVLNTASVSAPSYTISSGAGLNYPNTSATTATTYNWGAVTNTATSGKLTLLGEDADLVINGTSLKDTLDNINQRLAILNPNPELESEWAELRELGDQYRTLESKIKSKMKMLDKLKRYDRD